MGCPEAAKIGRGVDDFSKKQNFRRLGGSSPQDTPDLMNTICAAMLVTLILT